LVGISSNYIKADFGLSDSMANALGMMLFFWFLVLSVPAGVFMGKIGRKNTVVLSVAATAAAMLIPSIDYSFALMMLSFALLGIGNTLLQVSINPLVADIVPPSKLASSLTLGQFVKAIASFAAPIVALRCAAAFGNWKLVYPMFAAVAVAAAVWLFFVKIEERAPEKNSTLFECLSLLKKPAVAFLFFGILVHVGIDVGVNMTSPKILMERAGMTLSEAGYAVSLYFIMRTAASFAGAIILTKVSAKAFFAASVAIMAAASAGLIFAGGETALYVCIALMGIGNANIFSVIFSRALQIMPSHNNEISGLMVMGIAGGGIFPLAMGLASDAFASQTGAAAIIALCVIYLAFLAPKLGVRNA